MQTTLKRFLFLCVFIGSLLAYNCGYAQKSNKPKFKPSKKESLGEKDNSFRSGKFHLKSLFGKGAAKQKPTKKFSNHKKANRDKFFKKKYTGKKGFFGKKKSGWGGKSFKKNGKEDKRLFKAGKSRGRYKKKK